MSAYFHEQRYRSAELMAQLRTFPLTICGAGAVGANLLENLARVGFSQLRIIDRDRVEERNLSTQSYYRADIGAHKATILANTLYRALGVNIDNAVTALTVRNVAKLLKGAQLVVDGFDNSVARATVTKYCKEAEIPCLHVGLTADYAEVIWNAMYQVPSSTQDDVCDYPLARNLVQMAVAIASEVIIVFIQTGKQQSFTVTLQDFAVQPL